MMLTRSPSLHQQIPCLPELDHTGLSPVVRGERGSTRLLSPRSQNSDLLNPADDRNTSLPFSELTISSTSMVSQVGGSLPESPDARKRVATRRLSIGSFSMASSSTTSIDHDQPIMSAREMALRHIQNQQMRAMKKRKHLVRRKKKRSSPNHQEMSMKTYEEANSTNSLVGTTEVDTQRREEDIQENPSDDDMFSMFDWSVSVSHRRFGSIKPRSTSMFVPRLSSIRYQDQVDERKGRSVRSTRKTTNSLGIDTESLGSHVARARVLWRTASQIEDGSPPIKSGVLNKDESSRKSKHKSSKKAKKKSHDRSPSSAMESTDTQCRLQCSVSGSQMETSSSRTKKTSNRSETPSPQKKSQTKSIPRRSKFESSEPRHSKPSASAA